MRLAWVDAVKGFAMIGVVFAHVIHGYGESHLFPEHAMGLQCLWDLCVSFLMPLFFMLSGYLYELTWNEQGRVSWKKIKNKFFDIFVLYLVFSVLFWCVKYSAVLFSHAVMMAHTVSFRDLFLIPVIPFNYLWFLWVLAFLFLVMPCCVKVFSRRASIVVLFFVGYLFPWAEWINERAAGITAETFFYGGFYFVFGSYLRVLHFEIIRPGIKRGLFLLSVLLCVGNAWLYFFFRWSLWYSKMHDIVLALAISYLVWYILAEYVGRSSSKTSFLQLCGEKSLEIYLLHLYFVGLFRTVFYKLGWENLPLLVLVTTVIALLCPLLTAHICDRIPALHYVFHPTDFLRKSR